MSDHCGRKLSIGVLRNTNSHRCSAAVCVFRGACPFAIMSKQSTVTSWLLMDLSGNQRVKCSCNHNSAALVATHSCPTLEQYGREQLLCGSGRGTGGRSGSYGHSALAGFG